MNTLNITLVQPCVALKATLSAIEGRASAKIRNGAHQRSRRQPKQCTA